MLIFYIYISRILCSPHNKLAPWVVKWEQFKDCTSSFTLIQLHAKQGSEPDYWGCDHLKKKPKTLPANQNLYSKLVDPFFGIIFNCNSLKTRLTMTHEKHFYQHSWRTCILPYRTGTTGQRQQKLLKPVCQLNPLNYRFTFSPEWYKYTNKTKFYWNSRLSAVLTSWSLKASMDVCGAQANSYFYAYPQRKSKRLK